MRRSDALGFPPDGLPELVADQECRPELRRQREDPGSNQPVMDLCDEDGVRRAEIREVTESGVARD